MNEIIASIGSNCGDRKKNVALALLELNSLLQPGFVSSEIYETTCARHSGKDYMNAVVKGYFLGDLRELVAGLKTIEEKMGRNLDCRKRGDVPVDIDVVVWNGEILKDWDFRQKFFKRGLEQIS